MVPPAASGSHSSDPLPAAAALAAGRAALDEHRRRVRKREVWTLIDYDLPFTSVRLWVLDARRDDAVLLASRVSHAWKSGALFARRFSNRPGSNLSSIGSYVTARRTYEGNYGHSLRVRGLDVGVNDHAWKRDIVFHPDLGMSHSLGCFMLPDTSNDRVVDAIVGGSFLHVHRSGEP
jgi:hypothetical protein